MSETPMPPLRSFNPQMMIGNIGNIRALIQRIRQKDGGIGSPEDELTLHRAIHDLDLLVDIVDGLKAAYSRQSENTQKVLAALETQQAQAVAAKQTYERMIEERNARIKELEQRLESEQQ